MRPRFEVRHVDSWRQLRRSAATARLVAISSRTIDEPLLTKLRALRDERPFLPIVVITSFCRSSAEMAVQAGVDAVLWEDASDQELTRRLTEILEDWCLESMARRFEAAGHLRPRLRHALVQLFRSDPPIPSVNSLARACGLRRAESLSRAYRLDAPEGSIKLYDLLNAVMLVRALMGSGPGGSFAGVCETLGISERRLDRAAQRFLGRHLSACSQEDSPALLDYLRSNVRHLVSGA